MNMIPATPHGTHSQAEKRVFDRLRTALADDPSWTAYHSLNLTSHAYKRFGEVDFLLCGEDGMFVLEVKGGRVGCQDGVWHYTNRYGQVSKSVEGPFKQAESALHGLVSKMRNALSDRIVSQLTIGFGVIFPDCEWRLPGAEWDPETLADARQFRNLEQWLKELFEYWHRKENCPRKPAAASLKSLKQFLRPEFETAELLYIQAGLAEDNVAAFTEDQMVLVDIVNANARVLCYGGAGTGKTFLALELARRWTAEGHRVLLACRSTWLKRYLESRFVVPELTVSLVGSVRTAARRSGVDRFDALIVDEGQDVMDVDSLGQLDAALRGGFKNGRWCFFHDINNQSGLFGAVDSDALEFLDRCHPARVPLRKNCRNTRLILEKVKNMTGADMGVRGAGDGPQVREYSVCSREESAALLADELYEMIDVGGIPSGSVTILSSLPFEESSAALLPDSIREQLILLDEYSLRSFPGQAMSFAEIPNFKGLENEAIIIVDLAHPRRGIELPALHYVAMSRARAVLSLIFQ